MVASVLKENINYMWTEGKWLCWRFHWIGSQLEFIVWSHSCGRPQRSRPLSYQHFFSRIWLKPNCKVPKLFPLNGIYWEKFNEIRLHFLKPFRSRTRRNICKLSNKKNIFFWGKNGGEIFLCTSVGKRRRVYDTANCGVHSPFSWKPIRAHADSF